jgi:putative RecB family exonuclease
MTEEKKHISFSELKEWEKCPFSHKLMYIDGMKHFRGNEYTAFGTAIHNTCEKLLVEKKKNNNHNVDEKKLFEIYFKDEVADLKDIKVNKKMVEDMKEQGKELASLVYSKLSKYFKEYDLISAEEMLYVPIKEYTKGEYNFKGYIDLVLKTKDGKYHIIDWKSCSWGWDARRKADTMTTYQLTLYKHYFAIKHNIKPEKIETYFALLKRTAKKNKIEMVKVRNGSRKMQNAVNLLKTGLYNIDKQNYLKKKTSCQRCEFYQTDECPRGKTW